MTKKKKENTDIKLTITMLVSNRKDTIRKCMDSINPILKQVASELIVVDTGSTDGSIDIVREYADKIIPFTWCNDFSAARNAGLKQARGEWAMFLDDDEWFEDVTEIVEFFNTGEYKQYNSGVYIARNYGDFEGNTWSDSNAVRMVKRCPVTEFKGKIHEYIWPHVQPTKYFQAYVHHYGYVFSNPEERKKHAIRNINLLEQEIKEDPKNVHIRIQAIQEYFGEGEIRKALELCQGVLEDYEKDKNIDSGISIGYCSNYTLRSYIALGEWETGYQWGKAYLANGTTTSIALLGNVREMIQLCRRTERYQEGIRCLKKYLEVFDILTQNINREEVLLDLSKYLQEGERERVYREGIALGVLGKDYELVEECLNAIDWDKKPFYIYSDTLDFFVQYLSGIALERKHIEIFDKLLEKKYFSKTIENSINKYRDIDKKYENLLSIFAESKVDDTYVKKSRFYYHAYYAKDWTKEEMEQEMVQLLEKMPNLLSMEESIWGIIESYNLNLDKFIQGISFIRWFTLVREWMELGLRNKVDIKKIYGVLRPEEKSDLRYRFMNIKYKEYEISKILPETMNENVFSLLEEYSIMANDFYEKIYSSFVFEEENITILPPEGVFAFYIKEAAAKKKQADNLAYSKALVKAGQAHPGMKELCKALLKQEQEKVNQMNEEKREFMDLANQIKDKVHTMIRNGNYEAAKMTIEQLEKILPKDEEVENLKVLIEKNMK